MVAELDGSRIIKLREVCHYVGIGRSTLYRRVSEGTFPAPVRLGPRSIGWKTRDILAWLEDPGRVWNPTEIR